VIVSGGQTGVDRAALDAAILAGVPYDGWCPAGGWAEDLPDPPGLLAHYPRLRETTSADPAERTRLNVRDSDATLVVQPSGGLAGGTLLTAEEARRLGRPLLVTSGDSVDEVVAWVRSIPSVHDTIRLDVAGPRESGHPGAYALTRRLLDAVLQAGAG
jgi:hypothetical protein